MKILFPLIFLSFTGLHSLAQDGDKLFYLQKSEKYRKMRNTGTMLTIGGTALAVIGLVSMMNVSDNTTYYNGSTTTTTTNTSDAARGALMYLGGNVMVGVGVPLWIVGGINHGKYERKLQSFSAKVLVGPQASGLRLTYRF